MSTPNQNRRFSLREFQVLVKSLVRESIGEAYGSGYGREGSGDWLPDEEGDRRRREAERARQKPMDTHLRNVWQAGQDQEKADIDRERKWRQQQAQQAQDANIAAAEKYAAGKKAAEDQEEQDYQAQKAAKAARIAAYRKAHPVKSFFYGANPPPEFQAEAYDRETQGYLDRMTWGVMPSDDLLEIALADGWHMELKGRDALAFKVAMEMAGLEPGRAEWGMSTVDGMKQVIEALVSCSQDVDPEMTEICDTAGSLAGSIMDVLGFEWI